MKSFSPKIRIPIISEKMALVALIAILIIINALLYYKYSNNEVKDPDPMLYHNIANVLLNFETSFPNGDDIAKQVTPGYPIFIAILYKVFGINPIAVYLVQAFLSMGCILLTFYILKNHTNNNIALLGSAWLALYIPLWKMSYSLMMEVFTTFMLVLIIFTLAKWLKSKEFKHITILSILFLILIFVNNRFIAHFIGLIAVLVLIRQFLVPTISYKQIFLSLVIVTLGLTFWHIRQYHVFNEFVVFTPGRIPDINKTEKLNTFWDYNEYLQAFNKEGLNKESVSKFKKDFTIEKYNELKVKFINRKPWINYWNRALEFWRIMRTSIGISPGDSRLIPPASTFRNLFEIIMLLPVFILSIIGFFVSFHRRTPLFIIVSSFILMHWVLHSLTHYVSRYRLTIIPLFFMLAFWTLFEVHNSYKSHRTIHS